MKKEETYCRLLPMAGAYNMRDLGGYRTVYGKCVKWKMLFRSDDMNKLTAMDLDISLYCHCVRLSTSGVK